MKTLQHSFLNLLNIQSNSYFQQIKKSRWSHLMTLMVFMAMLPLQNVKAGYFYEYTDNFTVAKTVGYENSAVDIQLLALNKDGDNDRMLDATLYYSLNGTNWIPIINYNALSQDADINKQLTNALFKASADVSDSKTIIKKEGFVQKTSLGYSTLIPYQAFLKFKWFYPASIKGQKVIFGIKGTWQRNYSATSGSAKDVLDYVGTKTYPIKYTQREFQLPDEYLPSTKPTCTIIPLETGKFNFKWSLGDKLMSKFVLYSDISFTNPIDSLTAVTATGEGAVGLGTFNINNSYYVKQIYQTPSDISGFSLRYEIKGADKVVHQGYSVPREITASFDPCTKKTLLKWKNVIPTGSDIGSKLYVFRKQGKQEYYKNLNSGIGIGRTEYQDLDELLFDTTYTYIVRSYPNIFDIANSNLTIAKAENYFPEMHDSVITIPKRKVLTFGNFKVATNISAGTTACNAVITWDPFVCVDKSKTIKIHRKNIANNTEITISALYDNCKYTDYDVIENNYYDYWLEVDNYGKIETSDVKKNVIIVDQAKFIRFTTTKGVLNDRVRLLWEIDKPTLNTKYIISRKIYGDKNYDVIAEKESKNKIETYEDLAIAPGILYEYKVASYYQPTTGLAVTTYTNDVVGMANSEGFGFSQPIGTVSGNITFGSGTVVKDVDISINNNDATQQLYKCLDFNTDLSKGNIEFQTSKHGCPKTGFTWQAWLKPANRPSSDFVIYELENEYSIRVKNDFVNVYYGPTSLPVLLLSASITDILTSDYFHLSVSYDINTKLFNLYINGVLKDSKPHTASICPNTGIAKAQLAASYVLTQKNYKGLIDEMRLWNRTLSATEILKTHNRYLSGTETDLIGYWQMDEGIEGYSFDKSNKSKSYNEHHIKLTGVKSDGGVPTTDQLSIKATTDTDGNYIIQGVPYKGNGSTYDVVPKLGNHIFQPGKQLVFIGGTSSEVQSKIDFKDISSFKISGKILYDKTNIPVSDVAFKVDGNFCITDNKLLVTGAEGTYTIDVPIGEHIITLVKNGHGFIDDTNATLGIGKKYNFNVDKTNINFFDTTRVTLVGRVVGGKIQSAKPIGHKRSIANIGQATVTVKTKNSGDQLNKSGASFTYKNTTGNILSEYSIANQSNQIVIKTDIENGEFSLRVPPIPMTVSSVTATGLRPNDDIIDVSNTKINMNPLIAYVDTIHNGLKIDGKDTTIIIDSCMYHQCLNLTFKNITPVFKITDRNYKYDAYGNHKFIYNDSINPSIQRTINLDTLINNIVTYKKKYPIFTTGDMYSFKVEAYEEYKKNYLNLNEVADKVALDSQYFYIENKISSIPVKTRYQLNNKGEFIYWFMAGEPNIVFPYVRTMTAEIGNVKWKGLSAIVLGAVPTPDGVGFVTKGPDKVLAVLRDPPGSNSYATLEKGSSFSQTRSFTATGTGSSNTKTTLNLGGEVSMDFGLPGLTLQLETANKLDMGAGIETSFDWGTSTTRTDSYSFTETISTSSSPDYIGAMGDVYIANSSNIGFQKCNQLSLKPVTVVGKSDTLTFDTPTNYIFKDLGDSTSFRYTQNHIITHLIPGFEDLRKSILIHVNDTSSVSLHTKTHKQMYYTSLEPGDSKYGAIGTYLFVLPLVKQDVYIDSVLFYTTQIDNWKSIIKRNEMEKLLAAGNPPIGNTSKIKYDKLNLSWDAGTVLSKSVTRVSNVETSSNYAWQVQGYGTLETGINVNKFGFTIEAEVKAGGGKDSSLVKSEEHSVTYGYTLEDGDEGNYFSVDVFTPKSQTAAVGALIDENKVIRDTKITNVEQEGGPIFVTRGGATSCPYEESDMSQYYLESGKSVPLNTGTVKIENPGIDVKNPTVMGIASGKQASYNLELKNLADTESARWFQLSVDPASNPLGAIVSIDGTPLTQPRQFLVPSTSMLKTVKLSQSSTDDLVFDNILLVLESPCQSDIMAEAFISAEFVASCSDLTMLIDTTIINTANHPTTGINAKNPSVTVVLKDFDTNYKNFKGINVDYKGLNESQWVSAKRFKFDTNLSTVKDGYIFKGQSTIAYTFPMIGEKNQIYQFRARTICGNDSSIYNEAAIINVLLDMNPPQSMGAPSPSNGILTPETEISVTFNEKINTEEIGSTDIQVYGVLNGAQVSDNVGLQFDGTQKAYTESPINLASSFTVEAKFQINAGNTNGTIFRLGEGKDSVSMQVDGNNLKVSAGVYQKQFTLIADASFQYFALTYDAITKRLELNHWGNNNPSDKALVSEIITNGIAPVGRLTVGQNYKGLIRQLSLWNSVRSFGTISAGRSISKTGNELNLIGYWPMDEGYGKQATDKARSRNLTVNSSWFIKPQGKAATFSDSKKIVVKSSHIPIVKDNDFSVEFWFSGTTGQKNATLLSCGKEDANQVKNLTVAFNGDGNLVMSSNGITHLIPSDVVLDNNWHHFAMSVLRGGNANIYIDGAQKYQTSASNIGGMESDSIAFGARRYDVVSNQTKAAYNNYFAGSMDELRIWDCALTGENIRLDMHSALNGRELGLKAYYPFEELNVSNDIIYSLKDFSIPTYTTQKNGGVALGNMTYNSDNTPSIKPARARVEVDHSVTMSENKIVINITESAEKIENCVLEFEMSRIMDLNGNRMASPLKWSAYVDMNRLKWETETIDLTKEVLAPLTINAVVSNSSGKYENYVISGLPSWLSVNKEQGTLNPMEKKSLIFTVDNSINIGSYEANIRLTGSKFIDEILPISLKVTGPRPDWTVNPYGFETSMNVIGQIKIEGINQEDKEDIVAAFMGTRCVGMASPQFDKYRNGYYLYMDIYGNVVDNNQTLTYSLWDAGTGRIYPGVDKDANLGSFTAGAVIGSITIPAIFNATDKVEQQLSLKQGWNWLSTNVVSTAPTLINQFKAGIGTVGEQLKSKTGDFIDYSNGAWIGTDISLNQTSMYMLKTNEAKTVKLVGAMAKPAEFKITINKDWNWIGYVPSFVTPLKEALSGLTAQTGDQIKSQVGFASYSGTAWYGSLQYLMPGLGYMYKSIAANSFYYPSQYLSLSKVASESNETASMKWPVDANKYQMSMTVTGIAAINNSEVANSDMQLGVFVGDECRGTVVLKYVDTYQRYMAFLMVWGNTDDVNKKITFRSYNPTNSQELIAADQSLTFVADNITGSPANPYKISFITSSNAEVDMNKLKVYPNPVTDMLHFDYDPSGIQQLEVVDNLGRILMNDSHVMKNSINVGNLIPGVYTLRIKYNGKLNNHLFIRK